MNSFSFLFQPPFSKKTFKKKNSENSENNNKKISCKKKLNITDENSSLVENVEIVGEKTKILKENNLQIVSGVDNK